MQWCGVWRNEKACSFAEKKDLLDFYMGDEVRQNFKLIEKEIEEIH
jgi:hypothetical protein